MLRLKTTMACVLVLAGSGQLALAAEPPKADAKPVRVLLVAGAATREYQFVRNLFLREQTEGRVRLAVYLQTPPGRDAPREGVEQGATLLKKLDDLASYDAIVAFDPDWGQLNADQMKLLKTWVEDGGGLVLVAGPVNTVDLSRKANADKYKSLLELYPVVPADARLGELNDDSDKAFPLHFPAGDKTTPAFMKLDPEGKGPLAGWDEFFYGNYGDAKNPELERGFYHAYPIDSLKPTTTVLATLADPKATLTDGSEAPFLATMERGKGRVVYLASGELWRLRGYREAFHARLWTGLIRNAGAAPEQEAPENPKPSPDELSMEVDALRLLYAFDFTPEQRKDLEKRAKETMQPARKRKPENVSEQYLQALTELHDALADASDDDAIDEKDDAFSEIEEKEAPDLDDDVELTPAARKQATELLSSLKPSQLKTFLQREEDDAIDPQEELVKALGEVRDLKLDEWKDQSDEIADDAVAALAGADADKGEKVKDRVVSLLSKARGLTAGEFKAQKADLEKAAQEIAGAAGPDEVLRNRAEHALAALLSNPRLEAALMARMK